MQTSTLLGHTIRIGTRDECREHWSRHPEQASSLWTTDEQAKCLLMSPEELEVIMERKRKKPGVAL